MQKKVLVIVPVYNVEKYLSKCITTIVNQTYKNLEIILVDDGSTDGSGKLCDELALTDSRISVIHKENGGLSDVLKAYISKAKQFLGYSPECRALTAALRSRLNGIKKTNKCRRHLCI